MCEPLSQLSSISMGTVSPDDPHQQSGVRMPWQASGSHTGKCGFQGNRVGTDMKGNFSHVPLITWKGEPRPETELGTKAMEDEHYFVSLFIEGWQVDAGQPDWG